MATQISQKTTDLGQGWFANLDAYSDGSEEMTIRNPDKGQRINLPDESVKRLRSIFTQAEKQAA